jgi:hypothetical protein
MRGERPRLAACEISGLGEFLPKATEFRTTHWSVVLASGETDPSTASAALEQQGRRKGDGQKIRIAARLRRETTMTLSWIAEQLHMGAASHVACLLYRDKKNGANSEGSENTLF